MIIITKTILKFIMFVILLPLTMFLLTIGTIKVAILDPDAALLFLKALLDSANRFLKIEKNTNKQGGE